MKNFNGHFKINGRMSMPVTILNPMSLLGNSTVPVECIRQVAENLLPGSSQLLGNRGQFLPSHSEVLGSQYY